MGFNFKDLLNPDQIKQMQDVAQQSDVSRVASDPSLGLSSEDIDKINSNPELTEKLTSGLKPQSEQVSTKAPSPSEPTFGETVGPTKDISSSLSKEDIANFKLKNALKNTATVGEPYAPISKFDAAVSKLEPSVKMVSETPDIASKLINNDSDAAIKTLSDKLKGLPEGSVSELKKAFPNLSKYIGEGGKYLGPIGEAAMVSQAIGDYPESVNKAANKDQTTKQKVGNSLSALGNAALISSPVAGVVGSPLAGTGFAAAGLGAKGLGEYLSQPEANSTSMPSNSPPPTPLSPQMLGLDMGGPNSTKMPPKQLEPSKKEDDTDTSEDEDIDHSQYYHPDHAESATDEQKAALAKVMKGSGKPPIKPDTEGEQTPSLPPSGFTNNTVENLKAAQDEANKQENTADLFKAIGTLSGGLIGKSMNTAAPTVDNKFWDQYAKEGKEKIDQFKDLAEKEKDDPNSVGSVTARAMASEMLKKAGFQSKLVDNMSYNQIEKNFPQLSKMMDNEENRVARNKLFSLKQQELSQQKQANNDFKQQRLDLMAQGKLQTLVSAAQKDPRVQANLKKMDAANRIFSTVGDYSINSEKDVDAIPSDQLNKLPRLMVTELGQELNSLLANSNVTPSSTLGKILPKNLKMTTTEWQDFVTTKLNPAQQADFARLVLKTAVRQKLTASKNNEEQLSKYFKGNEGLRVFLKDPTQYDSAREALDVQPHTTETDTSKKEVHQLETPKVPGSKFTTKSGKTYLVGQDGKTATEI